MNRRNTRYARLADAVLEIEREMRQLDLWVPQGSSETPTPEALVSTQPFCMDTLTFPQWIQFVLLERISTLIEAGAELPAQSDIAPMAEEYFRPLPIASGHLTESIRRLDRILTEG